MATSRWFLARWRRLGLPLFAALLLHCAGPAPVPPVAIPEEDFTPEPVSSAAPVAPVGPAVVIALHPRVEIRREGSAPRVAAVLLALPPERSAVRLAVVKVTLKRAAGGAPATQERTWSRATVENDLALTFPSLRGGAYDVEVQTAAQIESFDDEWAMQVEAREVTERTSFVFDAEERSQELDFNFKLNSADPLQEKLALDHQMEQLTALYAKHPDATEHVDCWSSSEGTEAMNRRVSDKRCDWFVQTVWKRLSRPNSEPSLTSHGAQDAPYAEAEKNRLVRIRVSWTE